MRSTSALTNRESPESRDRPGPSALLLSRGSPPPSLFISSRLFTSATFPSDFDSVLLLSSHCYSGFGSLLAAYMLGSGCLHLITNTDAVPHHVPGYGFV
jgi:hypothetical protein